MLNNKEVYKGYSFAELTTPTDDGRYQARVAIVGLDGSRTRSQRFLDLEVFRTQAQATVRAIEAARAWIDENQGKERLALPTNVSSLPRKL